ncbi:hypothetical protein BOTBODRAFT_141243 [Botryobasidium botryosum FD-172 SS1]|uniref:Peptidylprolyl isomerase n=1 Tax=Botryobasidium botryosum (strain FD-172 SS1) TaxID=930990 RepID=A0A067LVC3_BOTB1|nr:hypothetical protein BOTBODRAFT_141243 [Botryobasidium botryosum FD-172 SS1]
MGHGNNDKMYLTHAEHSGALGQHTASSSGYRAKAEGPLPGALVPFDCCAISLQPFSHPVCARNEDGTGTVFDLLNIVPWLKKHKNTHPITTRPLEPSSLITLHYSRNANGDYHDPITFKTFSEHSHIVAIATTGNVFLADSVSKLAGGRDLLADVAFTKDDLITLQDPHNFGAPAPTPAATASTSKTATAAPTAAPSNAVAKAASTGKVASAVPARAKVTQPYNVSPYSTGTAGAAFTSTALDPQTQAEAALFDEEELMFEDISRERKDKDKSRWRAYVRVVTNMGGSLNLELFCEKAPKTCYNFLMLAKQGKYNDCPFHRLIPGFMIQGGDPTGTGRGGESYWGTPFRDEYDLKGAEKHTERGMLSMANKGMGTNGSQFFITFKEVPHLDNKHTVFGKLVGGEDVLDAIESVPTNPKTDKPLKPIVIKEVVIYQDPFEDYKKRLAKRLERQAQQGPGGEKKAPSEKDKAMEKINWFGMKLGEKGEGKEGTGAGGATGEGGGVGKYLNLGAVKQQQTQQKRAAVGGGGLGEAGLPEVPSKKKRKMGFGDFSSWA